MPANSKELRQVNELVTKVNSMIRGYITRQRFKKLLFLNRVTGRKAVDISYDEVKKVPESKVILVRLKEKSFGRLQLNNTMLRIVKENQVKLQFVNGKILNEGQIYSGTIDPQTCEKSGYGI